MNCGFDTDVCRPQKVNIGLRRMRINKRTSKVNEMDKIAVEKEITEIDFPNFRTVLIFNIQWRLRMLYHLMSLFSNSDNKIVGKQWF